jgi:hypothetical protein
VGASKHSFQRSHYYARTGKPLDFATKLSVPLFKEFLRAPPSGGPRWFYKRMANAHGQQVSHPLARHRQGKRIHKPLHSGCFPPPCGANLPKKPAFGILFR